MSDTRSPYRFERPKNVHATPDKGGKTSDKITCSSSNLSELRRLDGNTPQTQRKRTVTFKSPFQTPSTTTKSCIYTSTPGPHLSQLQERLNQWLHKRGKSLKTFHKLKFFDKATDDVGTGDLLSDDKENNVINVNCVDETLVDERDAEIDKKRDDSGLKPVTNFESIVKDALKDLLKLINDVSTLYTVLDIGSEHGFMTLFIYYDKRLILMVSTKLFIYYDTRLILMVSTKASR